MGTAAAARGAGGGLTAAGPAPASAGPALAATEPALAATGPALAAAEPALAAAEPVLAAGEIQGNVLPGFATSCQALLFIELPAGGDAGRRWLRSLPITTLADLLTDVLTDGRPVAGPAWVNIALSYQGLAKVTPDADRLTDMPFKQGLARRSVLLGDPRSPDSAGNCRNWVLGRPGRPGLDAVVIVAADRPDAVAAGVAAVRRGLPAGVELAAVQHGQVRRAPHAGHEPFGFRDDISQPGVRGLLPGTGDPLTPRQNPADPDQGRPGQNLVWPGEFVFGYPGQDPFDRRRPGPVALAGPSWARNGSYLVLRRLTQDVDGFRRFVRRAAADLARRHPGLAGLTPELLAGKLMGRWRSGAPVTLAPHADRPGLGEDPLANNDFAFAAPGEPTACAATSADGGNGDDPGDPLGLRCPRAAHIRRAYPRGAATPGLTEASIETHRLLRRSIAFRDARRERGILFLAYQTSIERQFEFVTRAWLNNPHLHDTGDGHDPVAGQSFGVDGDRTRVFTIPVRGPGGRVDRVSLTIPTDWVVPTGGGYFFAPSVSMIRGL